MIDKKAIEKYEVLFSSAAELLIRMGLSERDQIKGATDETIAEFCDKNNLTLPAIYWAYSRQFGEKARSRNSEYDYAYSIAEHEFAIHQANIREEWHEMMNVKELLDAKNFKVNYDSDYPEEDEGVYTPEIKKLLNVDDIFPFTYDPYTRTFKFFDTKKENPEIYYLTRYYSLTSNFMSMTNKFRNIIFMYILSCAHEGFAQMGIVDGRKIAVGKAPNIDYSGGFEWLELYKDFSQEKGVNYNRTFLRKMRHMFYLKNDEIERKENRILSLSEFENNFIEFMNEKIDSSDEVFGYSPSTVL